MNTWDQRLVRLSYRLWPELLFDRAEATDNLQPDANQESFYLFGITRASAQYGDIENHLHEIIGEAEDADSGVPFLIMERSNCSELILSVDPRRWDLIPGNEVTEVVEEVEDAARIKSRPSCKLHKKISTGTEDEIGTYFSKKQHQSTTPSPLLLSRRGISRLTINFQTLPRRPFAPRWTC